MWLPIQIFFQPSLQPAAWVSNLTSLRLFDQKIVSISLFDRMAFMYSALVSVGCFIVSKVIEILAKIFHLVPGVEKESNLKTRSEHNNIRTPEHRGIRTTEHSNIGTAQRDPNCCPRLPDICPGDQVVRMDTVVAIWSNVWMPRFKPFFFRSMRTLKRGYLFNLAFHSPIYVHEDWRSQNQTSLKQHFHPDWRSWKTIGSHKRGECLSARPYIRLSNRSTEGWHRTKNYTYKEKVQKSLSVMLFHDNVYLTADAEGGLKLYNISREISEIWLV